MFSELYLEELSNVIVATDVECQTDDFLDKPSTPLFIPAKSGKDVETQIEEGEVGTQLSPPLKNLDNSFPFQGCMIGTIGYCLSTM